jgi:hypothetical protein
MKFLQGANYLDHNSTVKRTGIQQWSSKNVYLAHRHSAAAYLHVMRLHAAIISIHLR